MSPIAGLEKIVSLIWFFQTSRQFEHPVELPGVHSIKRNSPPDQLIAPPAETTLADHFDCACGPRRNLSMEAGVYRCHGCGTTHHAQTLEGRKAAGK